MCKKNNRLSKNFKIFSNDGKWLGDASLYTAISGWIFFVIWTTCQLKGLIGVSILMLIWFIAVVLGLRSVVVNRGRKHVPSGIWGLCLSLASFVFLVAVPAINWLAYAPTRREVCVRKMKMVHQRLLEYKDGSPHQILNLQQWCDELLSGGLTTDDLYCTETSLAGKHSSFSVNRFINDKNLSDLPNSTVFLFESQIGWNQLGSPENCAFNHLKGLRKVCIIILIDGSVKYIRPDEVSTLYWKN